MIESNWDGRNIESELVWEAFNDENKKAICLNYCEAWPNRVEGSNNIIIDGTGVVPFLRSTAGFQKLVIMKDSYPATKEVQHSMNQASGDCVVFKEQVDNNEAAAEKKMSQEEFMGKISESHFKKGSVHPAVVLYNFSAEEMANCDSVSSTHLGCSE